MNSLLNTNFQKVEKMNPERIKIIKIAKKEIKEEEIYIAFAKMVTNPFNIGKKPSSSGTYWKCHFSHFFTLKHFTRYFEMNINFEPIEKEKPMSFKDQEREKSKTTYLHYMEKINEIKKEEATPDISIQRFEDRFNK